jgi:hypothetical protein
MRLQQILLPLFALSLAACQGDVTLTGPDQQGAVDFPEFDTATLVVHSPQSADILFLEDGVVLDAEVVDGDGIPMDFDDIVWELDGDSEPLLVVGFGEVDLDYGIYDFTVAATLPNGDRLVTSIGGVRVQGRHAGVYTGNFQMNIDIEFNGTPITASCLGGLDFVVSMSGRTIVGDDGACTINLFVAGEFDVGYDLTGEVGDDDDDAAGDVEIDLGFFAIPVAWSGGISDGELFGSFEGTAILFDFDGSIEASRVSLYVDEDVEE